MGEVKLMNVFNFVYLGHTFQADGDADRSVDARLAKASARFGKLHEVWRSKQLCMSLKLMLYKHAVISTLAHAHEAWKFNSSVMKKLNGWNSRNVAIITGRGIAKEAGRKQTFDLVSHLRVRRLA